jgi:hypothetical protein
MTIGVTTYLRGHNHEASISSRGPGGCSMHAIPPVGEPLAEKSWRASEVQSQGGPPWNSVPEHLWSQ